MPEDQQLFVAPLNRDTEKIYYNQRLLIDNKVLTEPRAWSVTKINRIAPNGIVRVGLAQDKYDQHQDYIEIDNETGEVVGMWADYYKNVVSPTEKEDPILPIHSSISYSGLSPEIKSGGGYKKFTVNFFNGDKPIDLVSGEWMFTINGADATDLINVISDENYVKVKFVGGDAYINSILTITYTSNDNVSSSIEAGIIAL